jgi:hypothetical protein
MAANSRIDNNYWLIGNISPDPHFGEKGPKNPPGQEFHKSFQVQASDDGKRAHNKVTLWPLPGPQMLDTAPFKTPNHISGKSFFLGKVFDRRTSSR